MGNYIFSSNNMLLDQFLKREFKDRWKEVLSEQLRKVNTSNINEADTQKKHLFIDNLLRTINVSPQRKEVYNSELKNILGIRFIERKVVKGSTSLGKKKLLDKSIEEIRQELCQEVKREVDGGYYKVESIFNLFWLKAIEAELKGVGHETVMKIVRDSLNIIKRDVHLIFLRYEDEAELNKEFMRVIKKINSFFSIDPLSSSRHNKRKEVGQLIMRVQDAFDSSYDDFVKTFLETINDQVQFKRTGRSDFYLVNADRNNALKTWDHIKDAYKKLSAKMDRMTRDTTV